MPNTHRLCLCSVLKVMIFSCRLFGLTPITWSHSNGYKFIREDGQCYFKRSKGWVIYSIVLVLTYNFIFYYTYFAGLSSQSFIIGSIYNAFATLSTLCAIFRGKILARNLNKINLLLRRGLMCQSSKLSLRRAIIWGLVILTIQTLIQLGTVLYVYGRHEIDFYTYLTAISSRIVHNVPFAFYYLFCTICTIYVSLFMCYETAMLQALTNNMMRPSNQDKIGAFNFARCTGSHTDVIKKDMHNGTLVQDLDRLRLLHEDVRQSLVNANGALNPHIPIHLLIELPVIIIHLFSTIKYITDEHKASKLDTSFILDWLFIIVHLIGLMIFLTSAQAIRASQNGPSQQVMEWSSKHLTPEEFAQMRLFSLKLIHVPAKISAGRLFVIDLTLLAPIAASVVTYLLVAVQLNLGNL